MTPSEQCLVLINKVASVQIATVRENGAPLISYSPYIRNVKGELMVLVSELAEHAEPLLAGRDVSALVIEPEADSDTVYARERLTFDCSVSEVSRGTQDFDDAITQLTHRHGEVVKLLVSMSDFHLIKLMPDQARYVQGFGRAFVLNPITLDMLQPIRKLN